MFGTEKFRTYHYEMDNARTYALRNPTLAYACAATALRAAVQMRRPDLAYKANELLSLVRPL